MPRVTVRGSDYNFVPMPDGVPEPYFPVECRLPQVEVGWSKYPTGVVEVGSGDRTRLEPLVEQLQQATSKSEIATIVMDFFGSTGGIWVPLDRDGVNTLIDRLRKARNDAYRADS